MGKNDVNQIADNVRVVHAGCGVSALSGLVLSLQCRENRPVFSACSPHAVSGLGF